VLSSARIPACLTAALVAGLLTPSPEAAAKPGRTVQALGAGGWNWCSDPRALHYVGIHDRTYAGWVEADGDEVVAAWDGWERARTVIGHNNQPDDHDNPVLDVLPDGRLVAFSAHHSGRFLRARVSLGPEDVTAWGPRQPISTNTPGARGYTYPNPINLPDEGNRRYLFWRGADWQPAYSRALGDGRWSRARRLISVSSRTPFLRPYVKYATDRRGTIAFAFSDGHPRNRLTSVRFALYRRGGFYRADGRRIGTLGRPLKASRADLLYNGPRHRGRGWVYDVALGPRGRPVVVYTTFRGRKRHRYRYAAFDGRHWHRHAIAPGGAALNGAETYYSGGIALDHSDPSIVYLSRGPRGNHQLERWRALDGGRRWRRRRVTRTRHSDNIRPVVPLSLNGGHGKVLWMQGRYPSYRRFRTNIVTPSAFGSPPTAEFEATRAKNGSLFTVAFDPTGTRAGSAALAYGWWDFGDGASAPATGEALHVYRRRGTYAAKLRVTDASGRRDVFVRVLQVP
jgi:hypothetical protein